MQIIKLARLSPILLLVIFLAVIAVGLLYTLTRVPTYESSTRIYVSTGAANSLNDLSQANSFTEQAVNSYAQVATTPLVLEPVKRSLHLNDPIAAIASRVSVSSPSDTTLIDISVQDASPVKAAQIANAIAARLAQVVPVLTPTAGSVGAIRLTQVAPATPSVEPISPNLLTNLLISAVAGLLIALVVVFGRERLDSRVRTAGAAAALGKAPLLGEVPRDAALTTGPLVVREMPRSATAEAFRSLRASLRYLSIGTTAHVLLFTSSTAAEGKTTTVLNLALALADAGAKVAIVDADLRRPRVAQYLGLDGSVGFTDVIVGEIPLRAAMQQYADSKVNVLPAGGNAPNPAELLQTARATELIQDLSQQFDYVLIDAPPSLPFADAGVLSEAATGIVYVVRVLQVRRFEVVQSIANLERVGARVLGVVATAVPALRNSAQAYYYGRASEEWSQ